jgi:hypothetical protein
LTGRGSAVLLLCIAITISACANSVVPLRSVVTPIIVSVPTVLGLSPEAATNRLSDAGLSPRVISSDASQTGRGTVTGSNSSTGVPVAKGAPVSIMVANRVPTPPTTPVDTSICASGSFVDRPSTEPSSICMRIASKLTVTFTSAGGWSGFGQWSSWPPTISDSPILSGMNWNFSGKTATAMFRALSPGTTTVRTAFNVTCAPRDRTPWTVPPEEFHDLTVTVVPG